MQSIYANKMSFTRYARLGLLIGAGMLFIGCMSEPPLPQYAPKALQSQGRGITVARSTPYNCKILGEVEGKDSVGNTSGATRERLREGAINDLKNEAGSTVGEGKRAMIYITQEEVRCSATVGKERKNINCTQGVPEGATNSRLQSHRMHAQVFDCGDK